MSCILTTARGAVWAEHLAGVGVDAEVSVQVGRRSCAWCSGPIPAGARRDAVCCSKRCRQARHRFLRAVGTAAVTARPLRLAYADPPYPGKASKYYRDHQDFAGEVDHAQLLAHLATFDGWALSTSADALRALLPLCPPEVRVAAWHRGERAHRDARGPLSAWEPVLYLGGRPDLEPYLSRAAEHDASRAAEHDVSSPGHHDGYPSRTAQDDVSTAAQHDGSPKARRTDSLVYVARSRRTDPGWVTGAKPAAFCRWLFDLLGAQAGDQLVDLFPGSGGVSRAWDAFTAGGMSDGPASVIHSPHEGVRS